MNRFFLKSKKFKQTIKYKRLGDYHFKGKSLVTHSKESYLVGLHTPTRLVTPYLICTSNIYGQLSFIPKPQNIFTFFTDSANYLPFYTTSTNSILQVAKLFHQLSNIKAGPLVLGSALGSIVTITSKKKNDILIKLPSGELKHIPPTSTSSTLTPKKLRKQKLVVRGVAKNPVDHPNGGRANTKQPLKTPWSRVAKYNK